MNILLDDGQVSGVIDWGDINSGDPACDLSAAWMLLPPQWHGLLRDAYGQAGGAVSQALWRRARGWALRLSLVFLAHSADNPQMYRIGHRALAAVLASRPPAVTSVPGA
jgi:aminoglycoside phosphotransferase (APT) family kinase protein